MAQEYSRELWARETRSRALSTVMIANIALAVFFILFHERLQPEELFTAIAIAAFLIQIWRTAFLLTGTKFDDAKWLKLNDRGITVFGVFWLVFSMSVALSTTTSDTNINAFLVILTIGYLSSSSQFFAYDRRVFLFFVACVTPGCIWVSTKFGSAGYQQTLIGLLPIIYAAVQIKTRRTLWEAMFRVSHKQNTLRVAIDSLPMGVFVVRSGTYEVVNAYAARLLQTTEKALIGRPLGTLPHDMELKNAIQTFTAGPEDIIDLELSVETQDGSRNHLVILRRSPDHREEIIVAILDIEALVQAQREAEIERERADIAISRTSILANELTGPLAVLVEQVLVRQAPDIELTREQLKRIQLVVNRLKAS